MNIEKLLCVLAIILTLSACASQIKTVYVPTPVDCPKPKLQPLPKLPELSRTPTPAEFAKWCVVTNKTLLTELKACRHQLSE